MDSVLSLPRTLLCALVVAASCASGAPRPSGTVAQTNAVTKPARKGNAWMAAKAADCRAPLTSLRRYSVLPGVTAPSWVGTQANGRWCTISPVTFVGRTDSLAQNVSADAKTVTITFYVAEGKWSYAIYRDGVPMATMESHYGARPVTIGDLTQAAAAIGVDAKLLTSQTSYAHIPTAHLELATQIGIDPAPGDGPIADLTTRPAAEPSVQAKEPPSSPAAAAADSSATAVAATSTAAKFTRSNAATVFKRGQWVAMPPMVTMLVKDIIKLPRDDGSVVDAYLVVNGPNTMKIPTSAAARMFMRPLVGKADGQRLLEGLRAAPDVAGIDTYDASRTRGYLNAVSAGNLENIARSYRELCAIERSRHLYSNEGALLRETRQWLQEELTTAGVGDADTIKAKLKAACE